MKKPWLNPVKNQPPKPETLAIKGDWDKFTADMKRVLSQEKGKTSRVYPGPASSS